MTEKTKHDNEIGMEAFAGSNLQRDVMGLNFPPLFEDVPWEFQGCVDEFQDPKDRKYNNCGVPYDADPCEYLKVSLSDLRQRA